MAFTTDLTDTERAYIAGLFDGEGCVGSVIQKYGDLTYPFCGLSLSQKDPAVLEWVAEKVGFGKIYPMKDCFLWKAGRAEHVRTFCKLVYPYSIVKKEQIACAYKMAGLTGWGKTFTKRYGAGKNATSTNETRLQRRFELHDRLKELKAA